MKPSFALNLSHDGLSLLHRATGGWHSIGEVDLDDPDLPERLRYLRNTATDLAGGQLASKLVIPNSQILYRTVDIHGKEGEERDRVICEALEGSTPYAMDDLVFDWIEAGNGVVHVAAVARETLNEAEGFATEHRFNPVSFVAIPENGDFSGEPYFGQSRFCETLFQDGEQVEPDFEPVIVVGRVDLETPEPAEAEQSADEVEEETSITPETEPEPEKASEAEDLPEVEKPVDADPESDADIDGVPEHDPFDVTGTFTTRRADSDSVDTSANLERVEARFVLYGDKTPADANNVPELGSAPKQPEITPMPVTAPSLAGAKLTRGRKKTKKPDPVPTAKIPPAPVQIPPSRINGSAPPERSKVSSEADAMTVFGARKTAQVAGKPKYLGLMLTIGLVALLVLAALLSSIFLDKPIAVSRLWGNVNAPVQEPVDVPPLATGPVIETTAPTAPNEVELTSLNPPQQPTTQLSEPTQAELAEEAAPTATPTPKSAAEIYDATGIWPQAPFPPVDLHADRIDDLYVASIDRNVLSHDAIALPGIAAALNDVKPGEFLPPPAAGTVFDLDERGFVRAHPDGALTPDGIRIYSGKPSTVPSLRPGGAEIVAPEINTEPELPLSRPLARPENLVETNERSTLGGRSRTELAAIRPTARPISEQEEIGDLDLTPTKLAVLNSVSPTLRPADFARTVETAMVAAALASAEREDTQVAQVASATTIATPQIPAIPTRASVAREATFENVLNLTKVNLVGIYGSSSDRRALVRLKSGRYVKVQVGDRLDGGKVAAIDTSALRYIKNNRTLTLEMPKG